MAYTRIVTSHQVMSLYLHKAGTLFLIEEDDDRIEVSFHIAVTVKPVLILSKKTVCVVKVTVRKEAFIGCQTAPSVSLQ